MPSNPSPPFSAKLKVGHNSKPLPPRPHSGIRLLDRNKLTYDLYQVRRNPMPLLRLCLLVLATLSLSPVILADAPAERLPIPSATKQVEAEQRIKSIFKTEYADRTPRGRASLARRLLKESATNLNDA